MWFHDDVYLPIPFGLCWFCFLLIIKVTKVARMLAAKPIDNGSEQQKSCTVMALLDGGMLKRHRMWLKVPYPLVWLTILNLSITEKSFIDVFLLSIGIYWMVVFSFVTWFFNCMFTSYNKKNIMYMVW